MRQRTAPVRRRRTGFTLIEMLVVIGLLLVLATLTVAIAPRFMERQKVAKAADQLQGWLLIAKQRAKNDRSPTGVRLYLTGNPPRALELQYIQQPDDLRVGKLQVPSPPGNQVNFIKALPTDGDLTGGVGPTALKSFWAVQAGDYLEVKGCGLLHQIVDIVNPQQLYVYPKALVPGKLPPFPFQIADTDDYRIIRQPRLLQGETPLQLAQDVGVDFAPNRSVGFPQSVPPPPSYDILFAPSGSVLKPAASGDKLMLWLRDLTQDASNPGDQILITIHLRTGLIAAHPVDTGSADPYTFAKDARSSGL